jgi:hypothetical protein
MKTRIWIKMAIIILILALGVDLVQASPIQAKANTISQAFWWLTDYVDQPSDVGAYASLAFDPGNGRPWISYYNASVTALRVAHFIGSGGNCGPSNRWLCETVDNSGSMGTFSSIDVFPNTGSPPLNTRRVGVAYFDAGIGALKFAEYTCIPSCSWKVVTIQDDDYIGAPSYGQYASLKYDLNGKPMIAFYMNSSLFNDEINFAYKVPSGGNCGLGSEAGLWQCDTVDSGVNLGQYASLDYNAAYGVAYIAYFDGSAGDLKYAYYAGMGNCGTGNAWYCVTVDGTDGSDVGRFVSVHAPANAFDKLQFAYYDASHGKLKYAIHVGTGGNCGPGNAFQCDFIGPVGGGLSKALSLAVGSSNTPIIGYLDSQGTGPDILKVAQPAYSLGLLYGNCGPENPFSTWQCYTVDGGSPPDKEEAAFTSLDIDPNGLAMIAYTELDTLTNTHDLKIAYQRIPIFLPLIRK